MKIWLLFIQQQLQHFWLVKTQLTHSAGYLLVKRVFFSYQSMWQFWALAIQPGGLGIILLLLLLMPRLKPSWFPLIFPLIRVLSEWQQLGVLLIGAFLQITILVSAYVLIAYGGCSINSMGWLYGISEELLLVPGVSQYCYAQLRSTWQNWFRARSTGFYNLVKPNLPRNYYHEYEKHQPTLDGQKARWEGASMNPIPNELAGQYLLETAYESADKPNQLFNLYQGKFIKCRSSNDTYWHCYEITSEIEKEIGTEVLRDFLEDGLLSKKDYKKYLKM